MKTSKIMLEKSTELKRLGDLKNLERGKFHTYDRLKKTTLMSYSRPIYIHTCIICNIEFEAIKTAKYCSNLCRQKSFRQTQKLSKNTSI